MLASISCHYQTSWQANHFSGMCFFSLPCLLVSLPAFSKQNSTFFLTDETFDYCNKVWCTLQLILSKNRPVLTRLTRLLLLRKKIFTVMWCDQQNIVVKPIHKIKHKSINNSPKFNLLLTIWLINLLIDK